MMPPPTLYSVARDTSPSSTIEALAVVPPMSKVTIWVRPSFFASACAPTTPPAGPDSTMFTGMRAASASVISPPLLCISSSFAWMPEASRLLRSVSR